MTTASALPNVKTMTVQALHDEFEYLKNKPLGIVYHNLTNRMAPYYRDEFTCLSKIRGTIGSILGVALLITIIVGPILYSTRLLKSLSKPFEM
jgi:hypothetical protein